MQRNIFHAESIVSHPCYSNCMVVRWEGLPGAGNSHTYHHYEECVRIALPRGSAAMQSIAAGVTRPEREPML